MPAPTADIDAVRTRLRDVGAVVSVFGDDVAAAVDLAIQNAVREYSGDRPDTVVQDIAGNGTPFYALTLLTSWVNDWSRVERVEYPAAAVSATHRPIFLDPTSDWDTTYRTAAARYLRFTSHNPAASETIRVYYTTLRVLTTSADTIVAAEKNAVLDLAASYACRMLATEAGQSVDGDIRSDSTNYRDMQLRLKQQEEAWRAGYERVIGKGAAAQTVAAAATLWDYDPVPKGQPRRRWLTHGYRR